MARVTNDGHKAIWSVYRTYFEISELELEVHLVHEWGLFIGHKMAWTISRTTGVSRGSKSSRRRTSSSRLRSREAFQQIRHGQAKIVVHKV